MGYPNNQRRDNAPGFATQDAPRFTGLPDDFQRHDSNRSMNSYQQSPPMNPQRQGPPPGNYTNTNTNKHAREKSRERNRERRDNNSKQDVVKQTNREGMRLLTRQQVEQRGDRDVQMLSPRAASRDGSQVEFSNTRISVSTKIQSFLLPFGGILALVECVLAYPFMIFHLNYASNHEASSRLRRRHYISTTTVHSIISPLHI